LPRQKNTGDACGPSSKPDLVWIEPGFALGSRPYAHQRNAIFQLGIRVVVGVHEPTTQEAETWQAHGVRLVLVPTRDWVEIPVSNFDRVVEVVFSCSDTSTPVLLHCLAGVRRAPTFAAAVLCHSRGMNVDTALGVVNHARTAAKPILEQEISLRSWFDLRCGK